MAKSKRLSEVIDAECLEDGRAALDAFKSAATLERAYPKVLEAVEADAELRGMRVEEVLKKIAQPYLESKLPKEDEPKAAKPRRGQQQQPSGDESGGETKTE
jgi:hypothetical protein